MCGTFDDWDAPCVSVVVSAGTKCIRTRSTGQSYLPQFYQLSVLSAPSSTSYQSYLPQFYRPPVVSAPSPTSYQSYLHQFYRPPVVPAPVLPAISRTGLQ